MLTEANIAELALYAKHFNQRIGQLLDNIIASYNTNQGTSLVLFYIPDETLMLAARDYWNEYGG